MKVTEATVDSIMSFGDMNHTMLGVELKRAWEALKKAEWSSGRCPHCGGWRPRASDKGPGVYSSRDPQMLSEWRGHRPECIYNRIG